MSLSALILTVVAIVLVIVGAVALVHASYLAGAILVLVGLVVLAASRGGVTL